MITRSEYLNWESTPKKILSFLRKYRNSAFRPKELANRLHIKHGNVISALGKLRKKGLVENRSPYWIIKSSNTRKKIVKKKGFF